MKEGLEALTALVRVVMAYWPPVKIKPKKVKKTPRATKAATVGRK